jgi:hypothetical protein
VPGIIERIICNPSFSSRFFSTKRGIVINCHFLFSILSSRVVSYDFDDLSEWGKEHSLNLVDYAIKSYRKNTKEIAAFNEIPVMQRNFPDEKSREDHGFTRGYLLLFA